MTGTDILIARVKRMQQRCKVLRDDNQRLWQSREEWKRKHAKCRGEIQVLRQRVKRQEGYLAVARARASRGRTGRNLEPNVLLSERDIRRILEMPVRG